MTSSEPDPVILCQDLIRCESVTPADDGAQDVLIKALGPLGFDCHDVTSGNIRNTFFRYGDGGPHFCFAGHTDVVPPGNEKDWSHPPFSGHIDKDGTVYGRGTADMKGNIAAFVAAAGQFLKKHDAFVGSISLLITGDEEAEAIHGTEPVLRWMSDTGHIPDVCLVGEPSNPERLGQVMKIGRRGSLHCELTLRGTQGHVAYPDKADNPIPRLAALLNTLSKTELDKGSDHFPPSSLQITTVDAGNPAQNVIPSRIYAHFNIRYSDQWSADTLTSHISDLIAPYLKDGDTLNWRNFGDSFLTSPGEFTDQVSEAIRDVTGMLPEMKTDGGTSDARFIQKYCPVVEFGLVNATIHQVDERTTVSDLKDLSTIYLRILERYFKT